MKAVLLKKAGPAPEMSLDDVETPRPAAGEVLVRLRRAALNHLDLFVRSGLPGSSYPLICGADGAGEVESTGEGVDGFEPGDRVLLDPTISCGTCGYCRKGEHSLCTDIRLLGERADGTFAQFINIPATNVHRVPPGFTLDEAAAFPLTFVTAWRMLVTKADLRKDETVLIHGIGGGVATACLLFSSLRGARPIVTSGSDEKLERARELGALEGINYREQEVGKEVKRATGGRGVDVVVDSIGKATWLTSIRCLAKGGRLVTCGATTGPDPSTDVVRIFWNQLTIYGSTMGNRREFREMLEAVGTNGIRPVIDSRYALKDLEKALGRLEQAEQFGKIVLEIP